MIDVIYRLFQLLTTLVKLIRPGGSRTVIVENLTLKQQRIIHSRSRQRAPHLTTHDRALLGFGSLFLNPPHISDQIMIRSFNTTEGRPISAYWMWRKSNRYHMCRCRTHLLRDSLEVFGESYWITPSSGLRQTWKTSCVYISVITTRAGLILDGMELLQ